MKIHPEKITKAGKNMVNYLDYESIEFPVPRKGFSKIENKNNICINVSCYENKLTYPAYISDQEFKHCMDLFMISDKTKSHYLYIKNFNIYGQ